MLIKKWCVIDQIIINGSSHNGGKFKLSNRFIHYSGGFIENKYNLKSQWMLINLILLNCTTIGFLNFLPH